MVRKVECGHEQSLQEGDVVLSLNGNLMTRVSELDVMYDHDVLDAVIVRKSEEMQIRVPTVPTEDLETDRAVIFCGAVLHAPHHAVRQQISKMHSEIYVSARVGSPAASGACQADFFPDARLAVVPVRARADQLHHGGQRRQDAGPGCVCKGSEQDPRQHLYVHNPACRPHADAHRLPVESGDI